MFRRGWFFALIVAVLAPTACKMTIDPVRPGPRWSSAALGLFHTCGLVDDIAYCFGDDRTGQLGAQSLGDATCLANGVLSPCRAQPARVNGPSFTEIASGWLQTCGVASDGTWCWGSGSSDGHAARTDMPVRVTSTRFAALASRQSSFCGATSDGDVQCWPVGASFPVATTTYAVKLATLSGSYSHLCGLTSSGDAYCWGANEHGQLGTGDTVAQNAPTHAAGSLKFTKISAGFARTCAIATDRHAYCTGGTLWTWTPQPDDSLNSTHFVRVQGNDEFTSVTVGGGIACGVTTTGEGKCWGSNNNKQLGTGSVSGTTATPHTVDGAHRFRDIIAGAYHACGITVEGEMYCWGFDHSGQLGSLGFPDTCTLSDEFYACTGTPVLVPEPE